VSFVILQEDLFDNPNRRPLACGAVADFAELADNRVGDTFDFAVLALLQQCDELDFLHRSFPFEG